MRAKLRKLIKTKSPRWIFCLAYNFYCAVNSRNVRCIVTSELFGITENGVLRYASTRTRALTYLDGFKHRSDYLGKVYALDLIDFKEGDLIVDCGANMGDLYHWFTDRNLPISYIGFEPNPIDFKCLEKNVMNQRLFNYGLWLEDSALSFFVSTEVASSSFIEPPFYSEVIKITTTRLDSMSFQKSIKLLKLEAEGAEPEVLLGSKGIIDSIEYISADVGPERGVQEIETRDAVVGILTDWNFEIVRENRGHRHTVLLRNKKF